MNVMKNPVGTAAPVLILTVITTVSVSKDMAEIIVKISTSVCGTPVIKVKNAKIL